MSTAAVAPNTGTQSAIAPSMGAILARVCRDQGPEKEQTLTFTPLSTQGTPTALRTDRKIKFFDFHFRGRLTNGATTPPTFRVGPSLLGGGTAASVFSLLQQITVRGQQLRYGAQQPFITRGEAMAEFMALVWPNWVPQITVSLNGAAPVRGGATNLDATVSHTNDIDFVLPVPLFPVDVSNVDQVFYCLHGPDWPGNLYIDVACADATAVVTTNSTPGITFSQYGTGTGSPTIDILSERPLVSKDYMSKIRPAITFRINSASGQATAVVTGASGTGLKLADLTVGKDTTRIFMKTGTALAGTSGGVTVFGSLSDSIVTNTYFSLDNRQLRFQGSNGDPALQDYMGRSYGRTIPIGYKMIDFVSGTGNGPANPSQSFLSSKLTAARKFEVDGDVTAAANQLDEINQEMILGRPALLG